MSSCQPVRGPERDDPGRRGPRGRRSALALLALTAAVGSTVLVASGPGRVAPGHADSRPGTATKPSPATPAPAPPPSPAAQSVAAGIPDSFSGVRRIVAIGDIHGDYERFVQVLRLCKLTDEKDRWIGGAAHLVQTGDVLDRGPDSKKVMDLLMQLEEQAKKAGGAVHALIGNHEYMTLAGDLRYVSTGELAAFEEGPRITPVGADPINDYPRYRAAFAATGKYGRWIRGHNTIVRVNDTLFMHGGLSPAFMKRKIRDLNEAVRAELRGERDLRTGVGADPAGPLWYRGLAESMQEQVLSGFLDEMTAAQGARRIVMGHTIQERGITLRAGGRLALIDVGMSRWTVSGAPSCLVIEREEPPKPGPNAPAEKLTVLK